MQFNSGDNSITNEARFAAKASTTDLPIADITRLANQALDRLNSLVLGVETALQFDDPNHTDLSVGTFTLVPGQSRYKITADGGGNSILEIDRITVPTGAGGNTILQGQHITDPEAYTYLTSASNTGASTGFMQFGSTVVLTPTPTAAGEALIYFRRNIKYFTTSDTTVSPGFAIPYHRLVPLWIAYWWCVREGKTSTATNLMNEIQLLEEEFVDYYSNTEGGLRITPVIRDPR